MRRPRLPACIVLAIVLSVPGVLQSADAPIRSGLDLVPADAAFFSSWSRQGEQFELVRNSRAFAQLMEIPRAREILGPLVFGEFDLDNPNHVTMKQWLSQPFVQAGLDAISHEVFVYGDTNFTAFVNDCREIAWGKEEDRLAALVDGKSGDRAESAADAAILGRLAGLDPPGLVVGFKAENPFRARIQLMLLDGLISIALAGKDVPPLVRKQYGRETIQGQQFLTFTITGSMVLDQIEFKNSPSIQPETLTAFIRAFREKKMVAAVGFLKGYVILSLGGTTEHLQRLGQEEPLVSHPDVARIEELGDKRCTSIRYVASDYRTALAAYSGRPSRSRELHEQSLRERSDDE